MSDKDTMSELEVSTIAYVRKWFGWFGGLGDPPLNDDILAILRGIRSFDRESAAQSDSAKLRDLAQRLSFALAGNTISVTEHADLLNEARAAGLLSDIREGG
jgi:hypothetical protein